jgi:hypothetical protein
VSEVAIGVELLGDDLMVEELLAVVREVSMWTRLAWGR